MDQAEKLFGKRGADAHEDLIGIINAGYQRNKPYVRWNPIERATETLPTFCMVAMAGIGDQPDTIEDRGPIITMRRSAPSECMPRPYRIGQDRRRLNDISERLHVALNDDIASNS